MRAAVANLYAPLAGCRVLVPASGCDVLPALLDAALVLLFSLVASGQIKLRTIDGWQKIGAVLNQHTAVAA